MNIHPKNKFIAFFLAIIISLTVVLPVFAYDNKDLLPEEPTPVLDLAKALSKKQKITLESSLLNFESETGWKIRVLSQYDRSPGLALKDFWGLDERSLVLIADPRGGNFLNFNVGDAYFALLPRLFWVELQTRFGNQYYVKDHGEDGAIIDSISAIENCLNKGGCKAVPGLAKEQSIWSLCTSILGGIIAGFASFPRKDNQTIAFGWLILFSPLWIMLFGIFGIAPIITRTSDILPIIRNTLGFLVSSISAYLIAQKTFKKD